MQKMSDEEIRLHVKAVVVLIFAMIAIAMLGEVSRQNWNSKVTAYPTKSEAAIARYAQELLDEMTLEQKVGQLFYAVGAVDAESAAAYHLGGVLVTGLEPGLSKNDVIALLRGYTAEPDIPMFVGVGEEGGSVVTVSGYGALRPKAFLSPRELMTTGELPLVEADAIDKAVFLRELGFHMNFAPVCDVVTKESASMYDRAAPGDADDVARYAETVVTAMAQEQVIAALKYFPGYGDLKGVSGGILRDERTIEQLYQTALQPYIRAIDSGVEAVLMGDTIVAAVDGSQPGVLSKSVYNLLRRELGFEGVIIGSGLGTAGMEIYGSCGELAVMAIRAGSDMLLTADYAEQIDAVIRAVKTGALARERVDEAVLRVLQLKIEYGIIQ